MARLFDPASYALATSVSAETQIPIKRPGAPEIERATVTALGAGLVPVLKDLGIADKTYVDTADEQATTIINDLRSTVNGNTASITNIQQTYATTTYVQSTVQQNLEASFEDALASVNTTLLAYATKSEALAIRAEAVNAAVADATASVTDRLTAYATREFALAQAAITLNAAIADSEAKLETALTAYVTETEARTISEEEAIAKVGELEASITTTLESYVKGDEMGAYQTQILQLAGANSTAYTNTQVGIVQNALGDIHGFWGVKINGNSNQILGLVRLDGIQTGASVESVLTFSVDGFRFSHVSAPDLYFRSTTRATRSWTHVFGASAGFSNLNHVAPLILYGPAHPHAASNPQNVIAIREGTAMIMLTSRITNLNQHQCIYYRVGGTNNFIALGAFSVGNGTPVTITRGADFFYGLSPTVSLEFYVAPCNALGVITAETESATMSLGLELEALSFNV